MRHTENVKDDAEVLGWIKLPREKGVAMGV